MASDNFNATNSPLPSPWAIPTGFNGLKSASGVCTQVTGGTDSFGIYTTSSSTVSTLVTSGVADWDGGPAMMDAAGNGYAVSWGGSAPEMLKYAAGVFQGSIGTGSAATILTAQTLELDTTSGANVVVRHQGGVVLTVADATYRAGLKPGAFISSGGLTFDSWTDGVAAAADQLQSWQRKGAMGVMVAS